MSGDKVRDALAAMIRAAVTDPVKFRDLPDAILASEMIATIKADVWDEGATAAAYSISATHHYADNPYRAEGSA